MIRIESVHIEEVRGIRKQPLAMNRANFVISGPNGSGKSGVVDAIQFALTGEIGRLRGSGTGDLKLADHGPHVDKRDYPGASYVKVDAFIPSLARSASITRTIARPKQPTIVPNEPAIVAIFDEMARHPEITLSRREVIKFILSEAGQRSRDVQVLLKLDDIDVVRATLKTTENKLNAAYSTAKAQADAAQESLKRHLDLPELRTDEILVAVNARRRVLGMPEIGELTSTTAFSAGIGDTAATAVAAQTKESALRDVKALLDAIAVGIEVPTVESVNTALEGIQRITENPALLASIKRRSFVESGLDLVDGPECPLCDVQWDVEALRSHLREKLSESQAALGIRDGLLGSGGAISAEITRLRALIQEVSKIGEAEQELITLLERWSTDLRDFAFKLLSVDGLVESKPRLQTGWAATPTAVASGLEMTRQRISARPDRTAAGEARDFLVLAQERLTTWQRAGREASEKAAAAARGKVAYKAYCDVAEAALLGLYSEVEKDFRDHYRLINQDDEKGFHAKLEPANGRLGLLVDFYGRGMFPPGAYHSEGHQDGMGVCLYLALMKRVLGNDFSLAILDDVVMSVDSMHRRQFCRLLKAHFPDTQFIITTHDQVWARQMRTEGLVAPNALVAFHGWSVETGPILDEVTEVWDRIAEDLKRNDVPTAAGRLRRHLEYVAADLADNLAAKVPFRGDGSYDMGELLQAVIGRQGELLKRAEKAARSWRNVDDEAKATWFQKNRADCLAACQGEQWIINKAIHYNEWADLSRQDFQPVVTAFRGLLGLFRCGKPACDSWMALTPRVDPVDLRCICGSLRLNLREK